mmetsp:Transcript_24102/g.41105  ORF Transcript_24102/g.41105 Transcript_24102/m.41105 type:complete len:281 (+) Transcript_24102:1222-2064(+)
MTSFAFSFSPACSSSMSLSSSELSLSLDDEESDEELLLDPDEDSSLDWGEGSTPDAGVSSTGSTATFDSSALADNALHWIDSFTTTSSPTPLSSCLSSFSSSLSESELDPEELLSLLLLSPLLLEAESSWRVEVERLGTSSVSLFAAHSKTSPLTSSSAPALPLSSASLLPETLSSSIAFAFSPAFSSSFASSLELTDFTVLSLTLFSSGPLPSTASFSGLFLTLSAYFCDNFSVSEEKTLPWTPSSVALLTSVSSSISGPSSSSTSLLACIFESAWDLG